MHRETRVFDGETRGFAEAGVSVAKITDTGITDAGIADAGIADAGFASREWHETRGLRSSADARKTQTWTWVLSRVNTETRGAR